MKKLDEQMEAMQMAAKIATAASDSTQIMECLSFKRRWKELV